MSPAPAVARYDEFAVFYHSSNADFVADTVGAALIDLIGPVRGMRTLDIACGGGRMTRELARRGAIVTGIDISRGLLDCAAAIEAAKPLGITYLHGDCTAPGCLPDQVFDGVTCYFGLSDIDDLESCLANISRVLRPDGTFTFAMLHPCFPGWGGTHEPSWRRGGGYFEEGYFLATSTRSVLRQRVGSNHRTLSTYLNSLRRHLLVVEAVAEPGLPAGWAEDQPNADPVPVFLVVRCRRTDSHRVET